MARDAGICTDAPETGAKRRGRDMKTVSFGDDQIAAALEERRSSEEIKQEALKAQALKKAKENARLFRVGPRYEAREYIGSGSYGQVCEAYDNHQRSLVAIKKTANLFDDLMDCRRTLREVAILSLMKHENIVRLVDVFAPGDGQGEFNELYMVMEVCDSDLKKLCRTGVSLGALHVRRLLWTLLCGLKYVHSAGIYHRDLKPGNCLVNQDCTVKVCDFGLARAVGGEGADRLPHALSLRSKQEARRSLTGHVVTRWYRAPELILLQETYTELIDVWSVGCIYAELLGMYEGVDPKERGPIFPGTACFPLSPHSEGQEQAGPAAGAYSHAKHDQLEMIFDVIGTPTEAEVDKLDDKEAKKYIKSFAKRQGCGFKTKLPQADNEDRDILRRMIRFNPEERWSVDSLLDHKLFALVRERQKETKASGPVTLSFKEEQEISKPRLREYILREIRKFRASSSPVPPARPSTRTSIGPSGNRRPSPLPNSRFTGVSKSRAAGKNGLPTLTSGM